MSYWQALLKTARMAAIVVVCMLGLTVLGLFGGYLIGRGHYALGAAYAGALIVLIVALAARDLQRASR